MRKLKEFKPIFNSLVSYASSKKEGSIRIGTKASVLMTSTERLPTRVKTQSKSASTPLLTSGESQTPM